MQQTIPNRTEPNQHGLRTALPWALCQRSDRGLPARSGARTFRDGAAIASRFCVTHCERDGAAAPPACDCGRVGEGGRDLARSAQVATASKRWEVYWVMWLVL